MSQAQPDYDSEIDGGARHWLYMIGACPWLTVFVAVRGIEPNAEFRMRES